MDHVKRRVAIATTGDDTPRVELDDAGASALLGAARGDVHEAVYAAQESFQVCPHSPLPAARLTAVL